MKRLSLLLVLGALLLTVGCATYRAPVMPPGGLLFMAVSAPLDTDMESTPANKKVGEASAMSVFNIIAFGDCSIAEAAEDGNLTKIDYADYSYLNILGLFQSFTTKVYGE